MQPPVAAFDRSLVAPLSTQEGWMRLALREAALAEAAGEVPVGAVVVSPTGEIIGRGHNAVLRLHDPSAHAEIVALRRAGSALGNYRLPGCILVCTLEPCAMCAGALLHARLARLIFGTRDPKAGACGSALSVLNHPALNHRMPIEEGVLAPECAAALSDFFRRRRTAQQRVRTAAALTETPHGPPPASEQA